ncbi:hypothetical protein LI82_07610 [Methanococcoides methylutens]|uniref:Uncharacterized protein n=1 Tax=Methanococcoides methylutens TaxID=2226 RepID=A0A099T1D3_METMT|nr:hypothetical protein [Methanococcoides methylutens]KGK98704.1 hypothetical protein LI82_07610 [Methanococcoides methylutens]
MDTDSIFVPPEHAQEIIDYFQPLNPYNLDIDLLKPEKEEYVFSPKRMDIDSIVVYGRSGSLSLEASIFFTLRLTENAPNSIVPTF